MGIHARDLHEGEEKKVKGRERREEEEREREEGGLNIYINITTRI